MTDFYDHCEQYIQRLGTALTRLDLTRVKKLHDALLRCQKDGSTVYLIGNGGGASTSEHIANDLQSCRIRSIALSANSATVTCLSNDIGYDAMFMIQLAVMANPKNDVLIALSGSGNSPNILRALEHAQRVEMESYAILGFDGGNASALALFPLLIPMDDQEPVEDCQLIISHIVKQFILQSPRKGDA